MSQTLTRRSTMREVIDAWRDRESPVEWDSFRGDYWDFHDGRISARFSPQHGGWLSDVIHRNRYWEGTIVEPGLMAHRRDHEWRDLQRTLIEAALPFTFSHMYMNFHSDNIDRVEAWAILNLAMHRLTKEQEAQLDEQTEHRYYEQRHRGNRLLDAFENRGIVRSELRRKYDDD